MPTQTVHSSLIHNRQKVGAIQESIDSMDGETKCVYLSTHGAMLLDQVKKWHFDPCYNMDELCKHYAEPEKADTKGTCTVRFHLYEVSKRGKSRETESRLLAAQGWEFWGRWTVTANRGFFLVWRKCSKTSSGDGYTTLWIYEKPFEL